MSGGRVASNVSRYTQLGKPPRSQRGSSSDRDALTVRPLTGITSEQHAAALATLDRRGALDLAGMLGLQEVSA